jgi:beta-glucosidase
MRQSYQFPPSFLWGAATSAYQVEGATDEGGRGTSIWDTFCKMPGRVLMDHSGDISVDHYHRYKEDVEIMRSLGLKAYRFSLSWSRLIPQGYGAVNQLGADFYSRLIDTLIEAGIQPWITLYHWDLPQKLEDEFGGWESRETVNHFADYASLVSRLYSDRAVNYMTMNEMGVIDTCGYGLGINPPCKKLSPTRLNAVRHNIILAHGLGVQALRSGAHSTIKVGLAENVSAVVPAIETEEHIAASKLAQRYQERYHLTPILEGRYHEGYIQEQGADAPAYTDEEMRVISTPIDFVGVNVYCPTYVMAAPQSPLGFKKMSLPPAYPHMHAEWITVSPQIAYWTPRLISELWNVKEIYITENGCACNDRLNAQGEVLDIDRVMYLRNHFIAAHRAVSEKIPLKGYFVWSLLDNFEWKEGYTWRFGIVYVNYQTLKRTPKLSAEFYKEVILENAVV